MREGMLGINLSLNARNTAPRDAKRKAGCWIAKPTIIGAITKAAALSPPGRLKADLSRCPISLKNWLPIFMLWARWILENEDENHNGDVSFISKV
jgi:hypothetical protein